MIINKVLSIFSPQLWFKNVLQRNIQVCVVGAASDVGSNVALLLKQNDKISKLHIYDDDDKVNGIGLELGLIPGSPNVVAFAGDSFLPAAVRYSDIIVMTSRLPRKSGLTRRQMLASNAPAVLKLCHTIAYENQDTFLAISTNPINSIIPFASAVLLKYNVYNPTKIFGITHLDIARAKSLTAKVLNVNPRHIYIPVIGGHSEETIVPLFSNLSPSHYTVDSYQADTLTRLLKKAGTEVINTKHGTDASILAVAWSVYEFVEQIIEILCHGGCVVVNGFTSNPGFGTRFFSGPVKVGPYGIVDVCTNFSFSDYEKNILNIALPKLNEDIASGEEHARLIENLKDNTTT